MLDLKSLNTSHIPLLIDYLGRYPRQNCDYSICNLLTWGKIYNNQYTLWREHLVLYNPQYAYVFFPVGPGLSSAELRELLDLLALRTKKPRSFSSQRIGRIRTPTWRIISPSRRIGIGRITFTPWKG